MSQKTNSGFGSGLLVGMIIGAVIVLLFTTRKGRKILRAMREDGFDKIAHWEKILDELDLDTELGDDDYLTQMKKKSFLHKVDEAPRQKVKPAMQRLFRGITHRQRD